MKNGIEAYDQLVELKLEPGLAVYVEKSQIPEDLQLSVQHSELQKKLSIGVMKKGYVLQQSRRD